MHRPHTLTIFPCAECVISGSCLRRLSRPLVAEKQRRQSSKRPRNVRNCNNFTKNALKMRLFTPKSGINRVEDLAKKVRDRTGLQLLCRLYTLTQVFVRLSLFGVMFAEDYNPCSLAKRGFVCLSTASSQPARPLCRVFCGACGAAKHPHKSVSRVQIVYPLCFLLKEGFSAPGAARRTETLL